MKLVVGLGNPGPAYAGTRHNVGFDVVDRLADRFKGEFRNRWRVPLATADIDLAGKPVQLVKPLSFMNLSGPPVATYARRKGIGPDLILVVVDDVELPVGALRIRSRGGSGGHNGLKSLTAALGTDGFPRLRIGVGRPGVSDAMVEHVLARFTPEEREAMDAARDRAADAVECVVEKGLERAMNEFNG